VIQETLSLAVQLDNNMEILIKVTIITGFFRCWKDNTTKKSSFTKSWFKDCSY